MAARLLLAVCLLSGGFGARLSAQSAPACPPPSGDLALPCQLDAWRGPTKIATLRYPDILLQADVAGTVRVLYHIDTLGVPISYSVKILESTHDLFQAAARNAVNHRRFDPPRLAGQPVTVVYEEVFRFGRTTPLPHFFPLLFETTTDRDSTGVPRTTLAQRASLVFDQPPPTNRSLRREIQRLVLREVLVEHGAAARRPVAVCVQLLDGPADRRTLRFLSTPASPAVTRRNCPRTYTSMAYSPWPGDRAPPGWVDPFGLTVLKMGPWARDGGFVTVRITQGTWRNHTVCAVAREQEQWNLVHCRMGPFVIS